MDKLNTILFARVTISLYRASFDIVLFFNVKLDLFSYFK